MKELGVNPTSVFRVEALVSNEDRVFTKFEVAVDVDSMTVEEVEDLGDDKGIGEAKADEGGVTKEGGMDQGTVRILNIP
jgi:hypothetical protein